MQLFIIIILTSHGWILWHIFFAILLAFKVLAKSTLVTQPFTAPTSQPMIIPTAIGSVIKLSAIIATSTIFIVKNTFYSFYSVIIRVVDAHPQWTSLDTWICARSLTGTFAYYEIPMLLPLLVSVFLDYFFTTIPLI